MRKTFLTLAMLFVLQAAFSGCLFVPDHGGGHDDRGDHHDDHHDSDDHRDHDNH